MADQRGRISGYPLTADLAGVLAAAADQPVRVRRAIVAPAGDTGGTITRAAKQLVRRTFTRRVPRTRSGVFGQAT